MPNEFGDTRTSKCHSIEIRNFITAKYQKQTNIEEKLSQIYQITGMQLSNILLQKAITGLNGVLQIRTQKGVFKGRNHTYQVCTK